MKAGALEYRLRYWVHAAIYALGFWAPWGRWLQVDVPGTSTWLGLAAWLARQGWMSFSASTVGLLVFGIAMATAGAFLRTWGTAYLGAGVVESGTMHGQGVVEEGPFRWARNPLYLGTWLHTLALALLMPVSGAVFAVVAIGVLQVRLILREEPFLRETLGAAYAEYCGRVPRLVPGLGPKVAGGGRRAAWGQAVVAEIYFWGAAGSFAVAGWRYNAFLLLKCVVVALGVSLVARGFMRRGEPADGR